MIRDVTERDYGIDCYIELVDDCKRLTGEIAFLQMKTITQIEWHDTNNRFRYYNVKKSTTNYLANFKIPTYVFWVDLTTREMFFISVKEYICEHFEHYINAENFAYDFYHDENLFTIDSFLKSFRRNNLYEQFRNELPYFISNLHHYIDFMWEHNNRDCFMQIEHEDMLFFESMHRNVRFLQEYFCTKTSISSIDELTKKGIATYGENYEQTLFEGVLTDMFDEFRKSILELVDIVVELVTIKESCYWLREKPCIFNYFFNLDKESLFKLL